VGLVSSNCSGARSLGDSSAQIRSQLVCRIPFAPDVQPNSIRRRLLRIGYKRAQQRIPQSDPSTLITQRKQRRLLGVSVGQSGSLLTAGRNESRQPQTLERGASRSSTDARHNDQFKNRDTREFNPIVFDLKRCFRGTEIPLLSHNF